MPVHVRKGLKLENISSDHTHFTLKYLSYFYDPVIQINSKWCHYAIADHIWCHLLFAFAYMYLYHCNLTTCIMKHVTLYTCIYVTFILMYVTIMPMGRKALGNKELELELEWPYRLTTSTSVKGSITLNIYTYSLKAWFGSVKPRIIPVCKTFAKKKPHCLFWCGCDTVPCLLVARRGY